MSAIITPALFFVGSTPTIEPDTPRVAVAVFSALITWRTRSALWTVVFGMIALWGLQALAR